MCGLLAEIYVLWSAMKPDSMLLGGSEMLRMV